MGERVAGQCLFRSPCQALVSILQKIVLAPLLNSTLPELYFYNYTWELNSPDYSTFNGHLKPARMPLTAIISGPQKRTVTGSTKLSAGRMRRGCV
jgi:hypothetical protein